uniref:Uncharacterized protein n=1 Tax=viral metagenome TaxID=1070528 RepID=A0A6C0HMY8_9ZZZZ
MTTDFKVAYLLDKIMLDDETSKCIKTSIDNIMKDGKIDQYDIPEILFLITEIINNSSLINTKLTPEILTSLIKELYKFIEKQYNLLPDETQKAGFDRVIDSCIKLILFQPKVKTTIKNCFNKLNMCCK